MTQASDHFDRLYQGNDDPWQYQTSDYERRKYDATLAALARPTYQSALEAGCSIGVLSARLAERCDCLLALDFSLLAITQARGRLSQFPRARACCASLPEDWPKGAYDLIMLSEILYYLNAEGIDQIARLVARDVTPGGECVLVQWQGPTETDITANDARDQFCATLALQRPYHEISHQTDGKYDHRTLLFEMDR